MNLATSDRNEDSQYMFRNLMFAMEKKSNKIYNLFD